MTPYRTPEEILKDMAEAIRQAPPEQRERIRDAVLNHLEALRKKEEEGCATT